MNATGYVLIGLTAIVAALVATVTFATLRFVAVARETRRRAATSGTDTAILAAALQEAVTKLKAQERATAARADRSEHLSGQIISSLTAGLLVVGIEGEIKTLNPAGRRMLDLTEATTPATLESTPEQPLFAVIHECLSSRSAVLRREVSLPDVGQGVHLGVTVSPLFDIDGALQGAICLFTDLSAVRDLEEQLRLKESLATVGELTAGIAHEFRNGLATIHGYSKLFDVDALPPTYRPDVEGIRAEAQSLGQVVTNFLNFARPAQLTLTKVELGGLCERAADEIRSDVRALGGDVEVSGEFDVVDGDEVLLRQAFSNLLRNAVEACAGASLPPRVVIHASVNRGQHVVRVSVNDNGPGIASASRERVFRPFFTSKRDGTGLGLALVQKIIVFHNGRVVAGASPFGGASLQVTLPLASA